MNGWLVLGEERRKKRQLGGQMQANPSLILFTSGQIIVPILTAKIYIFQNSISILFLSPIKMTSIHAGFKHYDQGLSLQCLTLGSMIWACCYLVVLVPAH